jgi:hypothetical protein
MPMKPRITKSEAAEAEAMNLELDYYELRDRFSAHLSKARNGDEMEGLRAFDMFVRVLDKLLKPQKLSRSDWRACLDIMSLTFHKVVDEGSDDAVSEAEGLYDDVLSKVLREYGSSWAAATRNK